MGYELLGKKLYFFPPRSQVLIMTRPLSRITEAKKFREFERDAIVLLSYRVKGLYEMKNLERYRHHIFSC